MKRVKEIQASVTFSSSISAGKDVGTYTATVIRLTNPNYILTSYPSTEYTINPKSITHIDF